MYYSQLVPGLEDMQGFKGFKDLRIRPTVKDKIDKLYNIDEGSAFYVMLGMLYIGDNRDDFGDCTINEGLAQLHRLGKRKLDEIYCWAFSGGKMDTHIQIGLGMILAWQQDASYTTINGHRLFSTVNGSYASNGEASWSNYLLPGAIWMKQRKETIEYVRNYHSVMDNRQFRLILVDVINQIRAMYREKPYMEFITVLSKVRTTIGRG